MSLPNRDGAGTESSASAEFFEALGHPTRIKIIEILGEKDQSFSEIKRRIGVESSGHLQFHLNKLERLVKLADDGKSYTLTDEGKESLRLVGQVLITKSRLVIRPQSEDRLFGFFSDKSANLASWRAIGLVFLLVPLYLISTSINYWQSLNLGATTSGLFGNYPFTEFVFPLSIELAILMLGVLLVFSAGNNSRAMKISVAGSIVAGAGLALTAFLPSIYLFFAPAPIAAEGTFGNATMFQIVSFNFTSAFTPAPSFNYSYLVLAAICFLAGGYLIRRLAFTRAPLPKQSSPNTK